ncbi:MULTISPECIES: NAD-binding protein [unclassified Brevibacillus]|uniref:NAD-binding protein n=1 Tax=unclassified Brevibacillus TaxID=2684853 RepID=UPI003562F0E7
MLVIMVGGEQANYEAAKPMLDIISESAVGTPLIRGKAASILADDYPAAFALKHMTKDLRLANEAAAT